MYGRPFSWRSPGPARSRSVCRPGFFVAAGLGFFSSGCAAPLGGAVRAYEQGRYPEAMDELRAVEADTRRAGSADAARYALYRGLAHLALGDLPAARFWFDRLGQALVGEPWLLSADDAHRFASALAHLPR
jgi:hypothetical protein